MAEERRFYDQIQDAATQCNTYLCKHSYRLYHTFTSASMMIKSLLDCSRRRPDASSENSDEDEKLELDDEVWEDADRGVMIMMRTDGSS